MKYKKNFNYNYRKQLIHLAKFYKIKEIKNYFKSRKKLTNTQIELILLKNRVKLPSKKTLSKFGNLITLQNQYFNKFFYIVGVTAIIVGFLGGVPHLIQSFHGIDSSLWQNKNEVVRYKNNTIDKILKKRETQLKSIDEEGIEEGLIEPQDEHNTEGSKVSLKASVVASLFDDKEYDLNKIRKGKKVKPFYISLLPRDISKIESTFRIQLSF